MSFGQTINDEGPYLLSKKRYVKTKEYNFKKPAKYTIGKYDFYFDSYAIREFASLAHLKYDSLEISNINLQRQKSDTISFNKICDDINREIISDFFIKLIARQVTSIKISKNNSIIENVILQTWTSTSPGCVHSGPIIFIKDDYLFHTTISFSRSLN